MVNAIVIKHLSFFLTRFRAESRVNPVYFVFATARVLIHLPAGA